jgi:hypothetical protein
VERVKLPHCHRQLRILPEPVRREHLIAHRDPLPARVELLHRSDVRPEAVHPVDQCRQLRLETALRLGLEEPGQRDLLGGFVGVIGVDGQCAGLQPDRRPAAVELHQDVHELPGRDGLRAGGREDAERTADADR